MTDKPRAATTGRAPANTISFVRTYKAPAKAVWDLWTTKQGLESWWGPDGFEVSVQRIDLRPGGSLDYTMTATATPQIRFMQATGQPLAQKCHATYVEVVPDRRLAYDHRVDFIPGLDPFDLRHVVEIEESGEGVRMVLTVDAMPDPKWNRLMEMGWIDEFDAFAQVLASSK